MNVRWTVSLAACVAVLFCGSLLAAAAEPNIGQNQPARQDSAWIIQNSTLISTPVLDPQGQRLGQIKDVLLDAQTGQPTSVILNAETIGSGHALLIVPYGALRAGVNPADNRQAVVLDLRADRLRAAPQLQEQSRNVYQIRMTAESRVSDTPGSSCPPVPCPCPPVPCALLQSDQDSFAGWPQSLIDFSSE
jgi:sporulation protein YlmC with PRC-barrel domain